MSAWSTDELERIGDADEMRLAPRRRDGSLRAPVTIWVVRDGDELYVRSYRGDDGLWYKGTRVRHEGHIRAGGVDRDVSFVDVTDPAAIERIDRAYRGKYRRYGAQLVDPMLGASARATTTRLIPR